MGTDVSNGKIILPLLCGGNALYIALLGSNKEVVVDLGEHFVKQSPRNRMLLDGPNGMLTLTFPVAANASKREKAGEVRLYDESRWKRQNWRSIRSCYGSSPYFSHYSDELESLFERKHDFLHAFNRELCELILRWMDYPISFSITDSYVEPGVGDFDARTSIPEVITVPYVQVFNDRHPFIDGLSVLDMLFNLGPSARYHPVSSATEVPGCF